VEGGLLDMHLACRELHSNTKGETLQYFKLPGGGTVTLLSAHNLPICGFDHDHYWADESSNISL
jgi:hypothetical protein